MAQNHRHTQTCQTLDRSTASEHRMVFEATNVTYIGVSKIRMTLDTSIAPTFLGVVFCSSTEAIHVSL